MHKYNKLRNKSINLLALITPFLLMTSADLSADAQSLAIQKNTTLLQENSQFSTQGVIGDRNSYEFKPNQSDVILLEVKRLNTEVRLTLIDKTKQQSLFTVSFPTEDWLAERILISQQDCENCLVKIEPLEQGDQSGTYSLVAKRLSKQTHSQKIEFETLMTQASIHWFNAGHEPEQLTKVAKIYQQAIKQAEQWGDIDALQRSRYLAAQTAHYQDDYAKLKQLATQVVKQTGGDEYRLRANYLLGMFAYEEDYLDQASDYLNQVQRLATQHNNQHYLASSDNLLGLIAAKQGRLEQAAQRFENSYQNFVLLGDWRQAVDGLINRGWSQYRQGNYQRALSNYRQALSLAKTTRLTERTIDATYKIGEVYARQGDTGQANLFLDSALSLASAQEKQVWRGRVLQVKAKLLYDAGTFLLAKVLFEDALQAYLAIDDRVGEINCRYYLARIHNSLGEYQLAYQYFGEVLAFDLLVNNQANLGQSYFRLAEVAFNQKNYSQAKKDIAKAINILDKVDDEYLKGRLYSLAGSVYFYNGETETAFGYIQQAQAIQNEIEDNRGQIETGYRIAEIYSTQSQYDKALKQLDSVMNNIELLRSKIDREDIKQNYLALHQKVAALQIKALFARSSSNQSNSALESLKIAESFRSQTLAEDLLKLQATKTVPTKLAEERAELQKQLQFEVVDYLKLSDTKSRQAILDDTRRLAAKLQQVEAKISQSNQTKINNSTASVVSIAQVQQELAEDSIILYFDTNPEQSYLWTITQDSVLGFVRDSAGSISLQVEQALKYIAVRPSGSNTQRRKKQNEYSKKLSQQLFSDIPVEWSNYQQLILVTDGPLNYLPFSMLRLPDSKQPLLNQKAITYAPSLNVLSQLKNKTLNKESSQYSKTLAGRGDKTPSINKLLLLANPSFAGQDQDEQSKQTNAQQKPANPAKAKLAEVRSGFAMTQLPYSQKEATSITQITPKHVTLLSQRQASKQAFYQHAPQDYPIIHFATHGLANSELPSLGGLVLSNVDSNDNLLLAPEISSLKLSAELVVLSGCETALGRLIDGEGLQGLSRSFFEAGAKRVVASLWAVQDDATAELMSEFYRALLLQKHSPAEALRIAKLQVKNYRRKNNSRPWRDPYYWAGFVLQGIGESWIE